MENNEKFEQLDDAGAQENLKKLTSGVVLVARDILKDPNFDSTIVLICIHSSEGTYGLVLNRPSHMPLSEIFDGFKGTDLKREVFIGGPVNQDEVQVLQVTNNPVDEAFQVYPNLYLGGKWEGIGHMIESDPETTRLFLGYSGWGADQLEGEVLAGAWDVYNDIDLEKLFVASDKSIPLDSKSILHFLK